MSEQIIFKICEEALREEKNESLFHKKEKKKLIQTLTEITRIPVKLGLLVFRNESGMFKSDLLSSCGNPTLHLHIE